MQTTRGRAFTFEERFGQIGARLDTAVHKAKDARDRFDAPRRIEALLATLEKEVRRVDQRLDAVAAQLDQDLAQTREDLLKAARAELEVWRARLDELRLHEELGKMEARDRLTPILERVDAAYAVAERQLEDLSPTSLTDWSDVQEYVANSLRGLRSEIEAAEHEFRIA